MAKQAKNAGAVEEAVPDSAAKPAAKPGKEKTVWQVTAEAKQTLLDFQTKLGGTQEQVLAEILEVYQKVSSGVYHNEKDTQQLAELTEEVNRLGNLAGNPEETKKLTEETAKLTAVNSELTERNRELTDRLTKLQAEVKRGELLRETFGPRNWDLLNQCIAVFNREQKVSATPEQYLMALFEHYQVIQHNYTLHEPLARAAIRETVKKYTDESEK